MRWTRLSCAFQGTLHRHWTSLRVRKAALPPTSTLEQDSTCPGKSQRSSETQKIYHKSTGQRMYPLPPANPYSKTHCLEQAALRTFSRNQTRLLSLKNSLVSCLTQTGQMGQWLLEKRDSFRLFRPLLLTNSHWTTQQPLRLRVRLSTLQRSELVMDNNCRNLKDRQLEITLLLKPKVMRMLEELWSFLSWAELPI